MSRKLSATNLSKSACGITFGFGFAFVFTSPAVIAASSASKSLSPPLSSLGLSKSGTSKIPNY